MYMSVLLSVDCYNNAKISVLLNSSVKISVNSPWDNKLSQSYLLLIKSVRDDDKSIESIELEIEELSVHTDNAHLNLYIQNKGNV